MSFGSVPDMTAAAASAAVDAGALLLDVREDFEWERGHAPQALHIAMSELGQRVEELPTDRTIVCVCHIGGRSAMVVDALNRSGWQAVNVLGGMEAWAAAGLPVIDDAGQPGVVA
ncbi:MAG TPA: rhodanese-like domain-containing protein [Acidothermaceae bacterium]|nr:rhodanese-like domain-containing protein [Acidothermaceae bacterium]